MKARIGSFRSPEDATRYYELYDEFIANHWPVAHEELDVPTRFGTTHVRRSGGDGGSPLILIHPTSGGSLGLHSLVAPFAERFTVYTPDTIGAIGRSVQTAPVESAGDLAAWLDDVLDDLGLEKAHLGGYSEGGWIAGVHASLTRHPGRLSSLTLIEPGGAIESIPRRTLAALIARGAATLLSRDKRRAIQDFSRWFSGDIDLSDDEIDLVLLAFRTFRQKLPTPKRLPDDQLRRLTVPTLLLLGADSRILDPEKVAERAHRLLHDVTVEITPDAGHGLPLQYPEKITTRILDFIAEHDAPP